MKQNVLLAEFDKIRAKHGGKLYPKDVVKSARPTGSPLHEYFDWNEGVAAEKWREHQARNLIRVAVTVLGAGETMEKVRAMYSLMPDRVNGGGYRVTAEILSDSAQRAQLLRDAMGELYTFRRKYRMLSELAEVFAAIEETETRTKKGKAA